MGSKRWTKEEEDYLLDKGCMLTIKTMAKKLGRTEKAIEVKMYKIGISIIKCNFYGMTVSELSRCCGHDRTTINKWFSKGLKYTSKQVRFTSKTKFVDGKDFWKFAEKNKELINFNKIKPGTILPEPKWFLEEKKKCSKVIKDSKEWTNDEDKMLISMVNNKVDYSEIAKRLNRSFNSIQMRISVLGIGKLNRRWTKEEEELLMKMHNSNIDREKIAQVLKRTKESVDCKISRLNRKILKEKQYAN